MFSPQSIATEENIPLKLFDNHVTDAANTWRKKHHLSCAPLLAHTDTDMHAHTLKQMYTDT